MAISIICWEVFSFYNAQGLSFHNRISIWRESQVINKEDSYAGLPLGKLSTKCASNESKFLTVWVRIFIEKAWVHHPNTKGQTISYQPPIFEKPTFHIPVPGTCETVPKKYHGKQLPQPHQFFFCFHTLYYKQFMLMLTENPCSCATTSDLIFLKPI